MLYKLMVVATLAASSIATLAAHPIHLDPTFAGGTQIELLVDGEAAVLESEALGMRFSPAERERLASWAARRTLQNLKQQLDSDYPCAVIRNWDEDRIILDFGLDCPFDPQR